MPKRGFKSYLLKDKLYTILQKRFEENKEELKKQGINSFSAFLTYLINKKVNEQIHEKKYRQEIEKIRILGNIIILKDNINDRIIELKIQKGYIFCEFDKTNECIHVGFAYSLPETYDLLNKK